MCRIAGYWDFNQPSYDREDVAMAMRDSLLWGGPDDAGLFVDDNHALSLTHRRLSILDLSASGHQPMMFEDLVMVYNGEVYNFKEIRAELEGEGYSFTSQSDTEVVLKAWHRWGVEALEKFRGMWAFALWDKKKKTLTLCRDRMGVKPLYWYWHEGLFLFASELKAFHQHPRFTKNISQESLALYLLYGFIPGSHCIFKHAFKLEPGTLLTLNTERAVFQTQYWSVDWLPLADSARQKMDEEEKVMELERLLRDSFELRMVSDVPVGIFLSGGIDSTLLTALLAQSKQHQLKTFTIGFQEKKYNEAGWAKQVAEHFGTDHTEHVCTAEEAKGLLTLLPVIYDEPFADISAIPTYLVSKMTRQSVKVALSADGGDEQFCGYTRYPWLGRAQKLFSIKSLSALLSFLAFDSSKYLIDGLSRLTPFLPWPINLVEKVEKMVRVAHASTPEERYRIGCRIFMEDQVKRLSTLPPSLPFREGRTGPVEAAMLWDLAYYLPDDILVKVDRASMSVALEAREPFLDHKLIEWSTRLPLGDKYRQKKSKYLLRQILYRHIPKELVDRPKEGFGIPLYEWFGDELKSLYQHYLSSSRLKREGFFTDGGIAEIGRWRDSFVAGGRSYGHRLYALLMFEMWREKWMG